MGTSGQRAVSRRFSCCSASSLACGPGSFDLCCMQSQVTMIPAGHHHSHLCSRAPGHKALPRLRPTRLGPGPVCTVKRAVLAMSMRFSYDKRGIRTTVRVISRIQDLG